MEKGIPKGEISTQAHIDICKDLLKSYYLPMAKIPELFLVDVEKTVEAFRKGMQDSPVSNGLDAEEMKIIQDLEFRKNMSHCRS